MANHVLLNNIEHKNLKINGECSAAMGDNVWYAQTFPIEFRSAQAHYPILFQKDSNTGQFMPITLFGFEDEGNLFLKESKWDAAYIPLAVQRLPFYIAQQSVVKDGVNEQERVITIDLDSPKVSTDQGIDLFLEYGGNSDYLEHMANVLEALHIGLQENDDFIEAMVTCELLESVTLDIELNDGSKNQLMGFYTINEDNLNNLSQDKLIRLHNAGFLQAVYMVIASQVHIHDLVARKNAQLTA
ncbi:SapC family protein [Colwellia sp. C1TZA3]|uniref:SapC family protein n=1 Tax=Colwellia sp. C1TZA3 TaxID=2508879 RepID=UPI0011BA4107|nr:SapC family protein [Colwellia sp. C1TZA3]TWX70442.1 SapC family protein [Colwellia sp. C1TZA3]